MTVNPHSEHRTDTVDMCSSRTMLGESRSSEGDVRRDKFRKQRFGGCDEHTQLPFYCILVLEDIFQRLLRTHTIW